MSADYLSSRIDVAQNGHKEAKKLLDNAKTFITYTLRDANGNVRYVGLASGIGTPDAVMAERIRKGHKPLENNPHLHTHIEGVQSNALSNQGAEDVLYGRHQATSPDNNKIVRAPGRKGVGIQDGANTGGRQLLNGQTPTSRDPKKAEAGGRAGVQAYVNDSGAWDVDAYESQARQIESASAGETTTVARGAAGRTIRGAASGAARVAVPVGIALDGYFLYDAYQQDGGFGENFGSTAGGVAGGWGGAAAGAAAGAALGSVIPGVGTVIGGVAGGIIGGFGGSLLGEEVVEQVQNEPDAILAPGESLESSTETIF